MPKPVPGGCVLTPDERKFVDANRNISTLNHTRYPSTIVRNLVAIIDRIASELAAANARIAELEARRRVMADRPFITCGHCTGYGVIELPETLWNTLRCLDAIEPKTTPEIMADMSLIYHDDAKLTAICNRLRALEALGLAVKRKTTAPSGGAWYLWKRIA